MSTYVVGDIQGCYKPLKKLLKKINFLKSKDQLWCVGDLINRGPNSLDTLRFLQDMDQSVRIVLGNHDLHFLAIHEGCAPPRTKDTLSKLLKAKDCDLLSDWLRKKSLAHYESVETRNGVENFLMVHAGVAPMWSLQKTLSLAAEVELSLQSETYNFFLKNMYGDHPTRWHDQLQGYERLRTITNYLTRIRFCDDAGSLRLDVKEGLNAAPKGCKPWYEFENISKVATILFGHWAAIDGETGKPKVHALDTGYVWGRKMTLMCLEDYQRYSITN